MGNTNVEMMKLCNSALVVCSPFLQHEKEKMVDFYIRIRQKTHCPISCFYQRWHIVRWSQVEAQPNRIKYPTGETTPMEKVHARKGEIDTNCDSSSISQVG